MVNKYLHKFESEAARDAAYFGNNYIEPGVSYTTDKYIMAETEHSNGDKVKCIFVGVKETIDDYGEYNIFYNEINNDYVGFSTSASMTVPNDTEVFGCFPLTGDNVGKFEVCGSCPTNYDLPVEVKQVNYNKQPVTLKIYNGNVLFDTLVVNDPYIITNEKLTEGKTTLNNPDQIDLEYNIEEDVDSYLIIYPETTSLELIFSINQLGTTVNATITT